MLCPKGLDRYKVAATGCWLWQGPLSPNGYGRIGKEYAHRAMYEILIGPIPHRMTIDHLCRVRPCVNPDHMEIVTRGANVLRGVGLSAMEARQTHCIRGHSLTVHAYRPRTRPNRRVCLLCQRIRCNERRARIRATGKRPT